MSWVEEEETGKYFCTLSFTRAEAGGLASKRRRAVSMFFFEATKWRAVWPEKSGTGSQ